MGRGFRLDAIIRRRPTLPISVAVYDPSESGRITSIGYSYDLKNLESRTIWDSTYYLLIFQNNTYYRSPRDRISRRDWTPFDRSGLEARNFTLGVCPSINI